MIYQPKGRAGEYCENALNVYLGCDHGCKYCYVPSVLKKHREDFSQKSTRKDILNRVTNSAKRYSGKDVFLSFTCDPYSIFDIEEQTTRKIISILIKNNVNIVILTKGGLRATRDFDILLENPKNVKFGVTLTCNNIKDSKYWEPQAADPYERILTLEIAKHYGFRTWVSCEPVIYPEQTLSLINTTAHCVDEYRIGKINYDKEVSDNIDWKKFINDCEKLFKKLKRYHDVKYIFKNDLLKFR